MHANLEHKNHRTCILVIKIIEHKNHRTCLTCGNMLSPWVFELPPKFQKRSLNTEFLGSEVQPQRKTCIFRYPDLSYKFMRNLCLIKYKIMLSHQTYRKIDALRKHNVRLGAYSIAHLLYTL